MEDVSPEANKDRGNQHQTSRTFPDLSNSTGGTSNFVPPENLAKTTLKNGRLKKLGTCFSTSFTHQNHQDARGKHFRSGTCNPNMPVAYRVATNLEQVSW